MAERDLFDRIADRGQARALFQRYVGEVQIETFSYCNRRCNYCPNATIDRISKNELLPSQVYKRVIRDLALITYKHTLTLNLYNEPLYDKLILKDIAFARTMLPDAKLQLFTNGDYLNRGYLDELIKAGLSEMHISIHLGNAEKYDDMKVLDRVNEMSVRLGIPAKHQHFSPGGSMQAVFPHSSVYIRIFEQNYGLVGGNRGGLLTKIASSERRSPCFYPFNTMNIAYNGWIMPCCQMHSDAVELEKYRIGNIKDFSSIFEAYANSMLVDWRRSLFTFGSKSSPCDSCNQACIPDDPTEAKRRDELAKEFGFGQPRMDQTRRLDD